MKVTRHIGGLEKNASNATHCNIVTRHIGGLENRTAQSRMQSGVTRHIGGLENTMRHATCDFQVNHRVCGKGQGDLTMV